jgi:hypothetical protein
VILTWRTGAPGAGAPSRRPSAHDASSLSSTDFRSLRRTAPSRCRTSGACRTSRSLTARQVASCWSVASSSTQPAGTAPRPAGERLEHPRPQLHRVIQQASVPLHRDQPPTRHAHQAARLVPGHDRGDPGQLVAALGAEHPIADLGVERVLGAEQRHRLAGVSECDPPIWVSFRPPPPNR